MKNYPKLWSLAVGVILTLTFNTETSAQPTDQPLWVNDGTILIVEKQESRGHVLLGVGKTVSYKTFASGKFKKGRIIGITDSTVSFGTTGYLNNNRVLFERVTVLHKDLEALRIPRSAVKKIAGVILLVTAATIVIDVVSPPANDFEAFFNPFAVIVFIPAAAILTGGGVALLVPKNIGLRKAWKLKTFKER